MMMLHRRLPSQMKLSHWWNSTIASSSRSLWYGYVCVAIQNGITVKEVSQYWEEWSFFTIQRPIIKIGKFKQSIIQHHFTVFPLNFTFVWLAEDGARMRGVILQRSNYHLRSVYSRLCNGLFGLMVSWKRNGEMGHEKCWQCKNDEFSAGNCIV